MRSCVTSGWRGIGGGRTVTRRSFWFADVRREGRGLRLPWRRAPARPNVARHPRLATTTAAPVDRSAPTRRDGRSVLPYLLDFREADPTQNSVASIGTCAERVVAHADDRELCPRMRAYADRGVSPQTPVPYLFDNTPYSAHQAHLRASTSVQRAESPSRKSVAVTTSPRTSRARSPRVTPANIGE